jgi:dienelactone hydrolase
VRTILWIVLAGGLAVSATARAETARPVRLMSADNISVFATYYPVEQSPAPVVVLVHGLKQNREVWSGFAMSLQRSGIAALTLDLRGHGESTRALTASGPMALDVSRFRAQDFRAMLLDVEAAVGWLQQQPEINRRRIALLGASLGANVALLYTSVNEDVAALALLSPGINYRGLRTDEAIKRIGPMPLRIAVSRHDAFAFESSNVLIRQRKEAGSGLQERELWIATGNLHGTDMLTGVRSLPVMLLDWFSEVLLGIKPDAAASPPLRATPPPSP